MNHHEVWLSLQKDFLYADHGAGGFLCMAARSNPEVDVGLGNVQISEGGVGHPVVVVLASMDQRLGDAHRLESGQHRCGLGEIGSSSDDVQDKAAHRDAAFIRFEFIRRMDGRAR